MFSTFNRSDHEAHLEAEEVRHVVVEFRTKHNGGPYDTKVFSGQ